ncbi:MAG: hypothetical protein NTX50_18330 [Candidatus Sumerlaeota bacterium]|nr:hypothetical protein [Candidatus Sumerlaeota bacterium]
MSTRYRPSASRSSTAGRAGGETVIAAGLRRVVFPERVGTLDPIEPVADRLVEDLPVVRLAREQFKAQRVADEGVGGMNFGEGLGLLALRSEIGHERAPELGVRRGDGKLICESDAFYKGDPRLRRSRNCIG